MPTRRYEVRISGRLSARARDAFVGMDVDAVPAETIIAGQVDDDEDLHRLLGLIQSLGLSVVSIQQVAPAPQALRRTAAREHGTAGSGAPPVDEVRTTRLRGGKPLPRPTAHHHGASL